MSQNGSHRAGPQRGVARKAPSVSDHNYAQVGRKTIFKASDIQQAPPPKLIVVVNKILAEEAEYKII